MVPALVGFSMLNMATELLSSTDAPKYNLVVGSPSKVLLDVEELLHPDHSTAARATLVYPIELLLQYMVPLF